jgi:hypothetical protein
MTMGNYEYEIIINGQIINLTCKRLTALRICKALNEDGSAVRLLDRKTSKVYYQNYDGDYHGN